VRQISFPLAGERSEIFLFRVPAKKGMDLAQAKAMVEETSAGLGQMASVSAQAVGTRRHIPPVNVVRIKPVRSVGQR